MVVIIGLYSLTSREDDSLRMMQLLFNRWRIYRVEFYANIRDKRMIHGIKKGTFLLILATVNVQLDIRFMFGLDYQRRLNIFFNGDSVIRTDASFQRSKIAHFCCSIGSFVTDH